MSRYDDYTEEEFEAELAWFRRREREQGYQRVVVQLPDGSFYWHLFQRGERINGGLSRSEVDAWADAGFAMTRHICCAPG